MNRLIALLLTVVIFTACGFSVGQSAMGTTGFMTEHNKKLEILTHKRRAYGAVK